MCNIEKRIKKFIEKYTKCKACISKRGLKRYSDNKHQKSNQRKIYYEYNIDKVLQQRNDRYIHIKDFFRSYVELESRLKAMEENIKNVFQ